MFSSSQLRVPDEDYVFQKVSELIQEDNSKKYLLKFICYSNLSSETLRLFFDSFTPGDIDFDLFECLKERLFCDVSPPLNREKPPHRYQQPQLYFPRSDSQRFVETLDIFLDGQAPLAEQTREFINYANSYLDLPQSQ